LLWDGACGFCQRAARAVERRDTQHAFHVVAYQQAPCPPMTAQLREACARAVQVVTPEGQVLSAGRAVLYVMGRLGHPVAARLLALPPLLWLLEAGYWLVARNRRLVGRVLG
jgi:predicted DCC family thiol-disulfide oxidoreductase YuxK